MQNRINEMTAHRQWASRPADQRFHSPADFRAALEARRVASFETLSNPNELRVVPTASGDLSVAFPHGSATLTNWSAQQLARLAGSGVNAAILDLSGDPDAPFQSEAARIAADYVNLGLDRRAARIKTAIDTRESRKARGRIPSLGINLYTFKDADGSMTVRAANSEVYSRAMDVDCWDFLASHAIPAGFDLPLTNKPGTFGMPDVAKGARPGGLYASDRDVFAILVNKSNPVEVRGDTLFRGIIMRHSEVGAAALKVDAFLLRGICGNLIMSGIQELVSVSVRHVGEITAAIRNAFDVELAGYIASDTVAESRLISAAMDTNVAANDTEAVEWLTDRKFSAPVATKAVEHANAEEGGAGSVWQLVQGLTATARELPHVDQRAVLARRAGELLSEVN